jgi:hypothetical protein
VSAFGAQVKQNKIAHASAAVRNVPAAHASAMQVSFGIMFVASFHESIIL